MNREQAVEAIRRKAREYAPVQLELLKRFSAIDSETHCLEGNAQVIAIIREVMADMDVEIEEHFDEGVGTHLIARIRPENPKGRIILNSHLDTVFPVGFAKKHPWRIEGDWLYGLGVTDCKGGFAVSCFAVKIMQELGLLPDKEITMIYSCDEEQGSVTSRRIFEKEAAGAECAFIFEGGHEKDGRIGLITRRKGVILGAMDIEGVEAHAGSAYLSGHSAVKELAHKILELYSFNDMEKEIYYNAAPVSGGRPNGVVAGDAHMEFCCAGIPDRESYAQAEKNIASLADSVTDPACRVTVTQRMLFPALEHTEYASKMVELGQEAGKLLGLQVEEIAVPAASDANYFSYYGIPAVDAFGPVGRGIHTTDECLYIPSLEEKTQLFAAMLLLMQ